MSGFADPTTTGDERATHYCGRCGVPLRAVSTTENATLHTCNGDYHWLADEHGQAED